MNCPKCNAELKPGARFCHVCGFDTQSVQATAPVTPVNPNQNHNTMEQNTTPTPQPQNNEGFDMNKVSKNSWIHAAIAAVGAIGVFLPWVKVSFWGISSSAAGINAWQGIFSLIVLLLVAVLVVAGPAIKMPEANRKQIMTFGAYVPAAFSVWVMLDIMGTPMVSPAIGLFITLASSVALILIGHNVIKLK